MRGLERKLLKGIVLSAGRNNKGRITVYHRGGGHKKKYRGVDFKRVFEDVVGKIIKVEYDPMRSGKICLVCYSNGILSYILGTEGIKEGDLIISSSDGWLPQGVSLEGSCFKLGSSRIRIGMYLHNVELVPSRGGQIARAAGTYVKILKKYGGKVLVKMSSGEYRLLDENCKGTVGVVSNEGHQHRKLTKAGESRWRGKRPVVRGVAMNPVDHPHGGGEGKTSGGRLPVTPWGQLTKGKRTRSVRKKNNLIVKRR